MIKSLTIKIAAWRRYRDSVRELSRLSDRELNDLGIGRADIGALVRQSTEIGA
jgi:uncharacterized protein YjiS (DUF1127 family)